MEFLAVSFILFLSYETAYVGIWGGAGYLIGYFAGGFFPHIVLAVLFLIWGMGCILLAFVARYQAKLAADCRVNAHMSFYQAYNASLAMMKVNFSFLPVVGRFFIALNEI